MSRQPLILAHLATAHKRPELPEYDEQLRCPNHQITPTMRGYGIAGGGIGPYTVCRRCGRVVSKSEDSNG